MYFKALKKALKGNKKIDVKNVERAYLFAEKAHKGQKRKTGEDYITHPVAVALKLLEIGADEESIIAGLLHDTVEDTEATLKDVEKEFGKQVATIIDSITKVSNINFFGSQEEAKTATIRKIFTGSIEDERAIFVKLADRAHNVETIHEFKTSKQLRIAEETMNIYYLLAKLFGVWKYKRIYEKYCFHIQHPEENKKYCSLIEQQKKKDQERTLECSKKLKKKFLEKNIDAEIKVIYKTPRELYEEERDLQKPIHEKFTHFYYLDIQVGTVDECYLCLGHIHSKYSWKENEFSDYISLPKNNGYQALHTTIFVSSGRSSEIHIKTKAMETINECGTFYTAPENFPKNMISNSLKALDKNYYTSQQYLQELKTDVLQKKIIVFAHTGETIPLPKNSSAIDFAYLYDCDKAHLLKEVKIDGEGHPVTTILQNGQVVEPVYNKKSQVRTFWLNHIHTGIAKNYISNWLSRLPKKELYTRGMRALGHEYAKTTKKRKLKFSKKIQQKIIDDFPEKTFEEVVISVGKGIISPKDFFQKYLEARKEIRNESFFYSIIDGLTSMYFRIFYFLFTSNRLEKDTHVAKIKIQSIDRPGMLLSILQVISQRDFNVASLKVFSLRPSKDAFYEICIEYRSHKEISELFDELLEVNGVKELTRA